MKYEYDVANINTRIGSFIRRSRTSKGLTGKALGQKMGLSQQHISRFERGLSTFSFEQVLCFLNALNEDLDKLIREMFPQKITIDSIFNKVNK